MEKILKEALIVIYSAADSGSFGQECALDFIEKYPKEYKDFCKEYEADLEKE